MSDFVEYYEFCGSGGNDPQTKLMSDLNLGKRPADLQCSQEKDTTYSDLTLRWHLKIPDLRLSPTIIEQGYEGPTQGMGNARMITVISPN